MNFKGDYLHEAIAPEFILTTCYSNQKHWSSELLRKLEKLKNIVDR